MTHITPYPEHGGMCRYLTAVQLDGAYRIAQYGRENGQPDRAGAVVLDFLRSTNPLAFRQAVSEKARYLSAHASGVARTTELTDGTVPGFTGLSPSLGAGVLALVRDSIGPVDLSNQILFAADSAFCIWGYVIDLDRLRLELYRGENRDPLRGADRFFDFEPRAYRFGDQMHPIKCVGMFSLDALPDHLPLHA